MSKTALIAGATGLIGDKLLELLLKDESYSKVLVVTRKPLKKEHEKLEVLITDFAKLGEVSDKLKADHVFCCLGTTMKKAGSKEKFRKVDYEYPLELARLCKENGANKYLLISAMGAGKKSSVFYNQVKGEIEEAVVNIDFDTYHIFRPSLLLGPRKEDRVGEDAAKTIFRIFGFLFVGPLKKYKAISYDKVAKAMLHFAKEATQGKHIHESLELQKF